MPNAIEELWGETAKDTGIGTVTVKTAPALAPPELALIVVEPIVSVLANPVGFTVATPGTDELHVTEAVRS